MDAFITFNKGLLGMPLHWQLWLVLLVAANLIGPLVFWKRTEAKVVLAVFLTGATLMIVLTALPLTNN